jgi:hypothetical protein
LVKPSLKTLNPWRSGTSFPTLGALVAAALEVVYDQWLGRSDHGSQERGENDRTAVEEVQPRESQIIDPSLDQDCRLGQENNAISGFWGSNECLSTLRIAVAVFPAKTCGPFH